MSGVMFVVVLMAFILSFTLTIGICAAQLFEENEQEEENRR